MPAKRRRGHLPGARSRGADECMAARRIDTWNRSVEKTPAARPRSALERSGSQGLSAWLEAPRAPASEQALRTVRSSLENRAADSVAVGGASHLSVADRRPANKGRSEGLQR